MSKRFSGNGLALRALLLQSSNILYIGLINTRSLPGGIFRQPCSNETVDSHTHPSKQIDTPGHIYKKTLFQYRLEILRNL